MKLKIRARHNKTNEVVEMEYESITQARKHNPYFHDFEVVGKVENGRLNEYFQ